MPPMHIVRGILRHVRPPRNAALKIGRSTGSPMPTQQYLLAQYRQGKSKATSIQGGDELNKLRDLTNDYFTLRRDMAERSKLYEMDAGAEEQLSPKELSKRAAARAGLQLPKLDPTLT